MSTQYTTDAIEVLQGLDPVKRRPGMYTDTTCPNHLAQEVIDNAVDEALAGYASVIEVSVSEDGWLEVKDNGRGMPTELHPEFQLTGIELILSRLHAGGKFSNQLYRYSGGLHGVGVSVVNALSSQLHVEVRRQGLRYHMAFAHGEKISELTPVGEVKKRDTGTTLRFLPNPDYFDNPQFALKALIALLQAKAILCPGLTLRFEDKKTQTQRTWCYEHGLIEYVKSSLSPAFDEQFLFSGQMKLDEAEVDWAVAWDLTDESSPLKESYVNLIPTLNGGTHVNGLRGGLFEAMSAFCELRDLIPKQIKVSADDLWDNCHYLLSIKMQSPQFAGQLKEKLSNKNATSLVSNVIKDSFSLWLNEHHSTGLQLAQVMIERAQHRLRKQKKVTRKSIQQGPALPGKLADCLAENQAESELFLVEGDSAGGSAKQARYKDFQAILPLRGKILNTWEVDEEQILQSQEVRDIIVALGLEPGESDLSRLRYGKICILADADSDGAHIATLLCALFLKHFKPLVENGHLYLASPPLYRIDAGKESYYAADDADKAKYIAKLQKKGLKKIHIQRFKGLGEMNPLQLRETAMTPKTRRLIQLTLDDETHCYKQMDMMLSRKRAQDRKTWLEAKGNLTGEY